MARNRTAGAEESGAESLTPDPRDAELEAMRAKLAAAEADKAAAQAMLDEAQEQIRIRPLAPGAVAGKPLFFALCEISNSGSPVRPGHMLPFDPTDAASAQVGGYSGLLEGVHYRVG